MACELRAVRNQGERRIAAVCGRVSTKALGTIRFSDFERTGKPVWSRGVPRVGGTQTDSVLFLRVYGFHLSRA